MLLNFKHAQTYTHPFSHYVSLTIVSLLMSDETNFTSQLSHFKAAWYVQATITCVIHHWKLFISEWFQILSSAIGSKAIMWCDLGMSGFFLLLLKLKDHPYDGSSNVGIHFKSLVDPFPLYGHDTMIKLVENQKITQWMHQYKGPCPQGQFFPPFKSHDFTYTHTIQIW